MQQEQNNKSSRKYLLSLLYTLKDLLFLILKSGIIGALIINILMYAIFKEPFDAIGCLAYIICGGSIGIVIGYIIKAVRGQDEGDALQMRQVPQCTICMLEYIIFVYYLAIQLALVCQFWDYSSQSLYMHLL